jgi:hypothetical protein
MSKFAFLVAAAVLGSLSFASAQTPAPLSSYGDANEMIDVQKFTCAQLAGTYQEDADAIAMWYSGWYNGLGKKHFFNLPRAREGLHR